MSWSTTNVHVLGGIIADRKIQQFADLSAGFSPDDTIQDWLAPVVSICLSRDLSGGAPAFSDWDSLAVFQAGAGVSLGAPCATLRTDTPVLCIIDSDGSLPTEVVAKLLFEKWEEEKRDKEVDGLAKRLASRLAGLSTPTGPTIPTSQERHWIVGSAVVGLKRFFHTASDEIAKKLKANPTRREDGLTDELVYEVFSNSRNQDLLNDLLAPSGLVFELSCEESGSAERQLGSDLGFCLTVRAGGLFTRRAILLQAKRLHPVADEFTPRSVYGDLLEDHGRDQARKMLDITACSYFLLYNPLGLGAMLPRHGTPIEINSSLDYSTDGISVLPASIVDGMDRLRWQPVVHLHPFTCSFVKFMVDDFIQGKVGDQSKRAVRAALTRKLRRNLDLGDDDDTPPPRFTISLTLDVSGMPGFGDHEK